jgi:hypothetical protein
MLTADGRAARRLLNAAQPDDPSAVKDLIFSLAANDGFGDAQLQLKYRAFSANEPEGNYVVTPSITSTFPTPSSGNGQPTAIVTPMLAAGKGFGTWNVTGTMSAGLPAGHEATIGRTYGWNRLVQDWLRRVISPGVEVNTRSIRLIC